MRTLLIRTDGLLRGHPWATQAGHAGRALVQLAALLVFFGMFYGALMGSYGGLFGGRLWQVLYSAMKVPLLLSAVFLLNLPSYFVLNTLLGLRDDFVEAVRALIAAQAGLAVILSSLGPLTLLWYASLPDTGPAYEAAVMFNGLMFAVASFAAHGLLRRYYRPLVARNARHRWALRCWLLLYVFVGIQLAWVLRPFIGDPQLSVEFFRPEAWGNAYVKIGQTLWRLLP
jgi:hypothetical protein